MDADRSLSTSSITIGRKIIARLFAEAAASPRREVCGLLFGGAGTIDEARPAANVAADPGRAFEIDPQALVAAHRAARTGGPAPIGCYHSHPSGAAFPSAADRAAAEPGALWLILGAGEARLWRAGTDGFAELALVATDRPDDGVSRP